MRSLVAMVRQLSAGALVLSLSTFAAGGSLDESQLASSTDSSWQHDQVAALIDARYPWFTDGEVVLLAQVIVAEATAVGLEPELVAAVIDVESSGRRFAVSKVGAMGLMQLLPDTARSVADRTGVAWKGPETLFDVASNIRLGVSYLDELVTRFGDLEVALTAYNWGPTRIARWIREGGELPAGYSARVLQVYATLVENA
jgi:soluble lytic murein transglycosylase-like protein